jgi:hypothetical protein
MSTVVNARIRREVDAFSHNLASSMSEWCPIVSQARALIGSARAQILCSLSSQGGVPEEDSQMTRSPAAPLVPGSENCGSTVVFLPIHELQDA